MKWFTDRKLSFEMLLAWLLISFCFANTTDPVPLLGFIENSGFSVQVFKSLVSGLLLVYLIILTFTNSKIHLRRFILTMVVIEMFFLIFYIYRLIGTIDEFSGENIAKYLLLDVVTMWLVNIFLFTLLYWVLDRMGPFRRTGEEPDDYDLLFPQYGMNKRGAKLWKPEFSDYFALAFTTSTTFGPTDTMFLSRKLKLLMILQVIISLTILTILATRAVTLIK